METNVKTEGDEAKEEVKSANPDANLNSEPGEPVESVEEPDESELESDDPEDVTRDGKIVVDEKVELYDKDEEIITKQFFEKNITQVTSSQLVEAGIDTDRMHTTKFTIGRYEISRQIMISKFTITKLV